MGYQGVVLAAYLLVACPSIYVVVSDEASDPNGETLASQKSCFRPSSLLTSRLASLKPRQANQTNAISGQPPMT
jgi:hypothetical protein